MALDLATYLLKLDIDADSLELIETEQQRVEDHRADLVAKVRSRASDENFILHIEIQNNNDVLMPWRMLRYLSDIRLAHPRTPVRQHIIYIGRDCLTMPAEIKEENIRFNYGLLDMRQVDCATLLEEDNPDALVLAILCDFREREPRGVVQHIFQRLQDLLGDHPKRFREYLDMLEILSENRNLRDYIKEAEAMLTRIDIEKLPSYELGLEKGMEKGLEKGLEKGMEKGSYREKRRLAKSLIGLLDDAIIAEKTGLSIDIVQKLHEELD